MKKAKIFLTALTVLTVVGGTVAFKVVKQPFQYYICDPATNLATIPFTITTETTLGGTTLVPYAPFNTPCINGVCSTLITTTD